MTSYPTRIVCLTEETTETLYLLGEEHRIVGISGYAVRPERARREKPRVSAFTHANVRKIVALQPDLVLGFSDLQADIAAALVRQGLDVHIFNQRSVAEILHMVRMLGGMIGCETKTQALANALAVRIESVRERSNRWPRRPRVYFEEWPDPLISGIRWVSELIAIAGGDDCFADLSCEPLARRRIIADPFEVVRRAPDIIIGSWCGRKFQPARVVARPGWSDIPAIQQGWVHEIDSSLILQPGPAALTDGLAALQTIIERWQHAHIGCQSPPVTECA